jgi:hypothetical protein
MCEECKKISRRISEGAAVVGAGQGWACSRQLLHAQSANLTFSTWDRRKP